MKTLHLIRLSIALLILAIPAVRSTAQTPTYSCIATNDTLLNSTVYQFDIYIYQTGTTALYLNNYQLSFQLSNTAAILNGGVITGSYVAASTQLPVSLAPGGVNVFNVGGIYEFRVNGVAPNSNGSLIPTTGLRIGTFQITNSMAFAAAPMNLTWWNTAPATTYVYAIVPPAVSGPATLITTMATHTTLLTNPVLNGPVTAFAMTGGGNYCTGGTGMPVGLSGSETGVMYILLQNALPLVANVAGTGIALSFGNQPAGTYTSTGYRKATYMTAAMTGSAVVTLSASLPASVTIAASANPVCTGTLVTFTATPVNGGTTPVFQWTVNSVNVGTNSSSYAYTPLNNDIVTCIMTSNAACVTGSPATSNAVTMTVNAIVPASVSIVAGTNPACSGASVTFTATPVNGGTTPSYQWMVNAVNAGTNSATFSYIPVNNDIVTCVMTSNASCVSGSPATSNAVTMTVNASVAASVAIAEGTNPVCSGTSVTFTATPTNGGTTPSYQWMVNGVNAGTNSVTFAYIPVNNDIVTCVMTSNATCVTGSPATSNAVTMTVNPTVAASVTVAAGTNPSCTGTSVTFTATPANGGTTPSFQWNVNGVNAGTNSVTFAYIPVNNDIVTCVMTSNATCVTGSPATSNAVTMTVNSSLPASVAIAAGANPVCSGTSVTFTATPTNGGTTPSYQWMVNGVNAGTNSATYSYIPVNNDIVTCVMTSNATCVTGSPATSNAVTMTVNASVAASVAIAAGTNPACSGTSVTFTATPTNGGTTPSYQWKVNGVNAGTNSVTFAYIPVNNDIVTCVMTSNATCVTGSPATSNAVTMTVNAIVPASVSIVAGTNPACSGASVTFTATPVNGGTTPSYQWMVNAVNAGTNSATFPYIPVNNDIVTCVMTSNASCVSGSPATSNAVTMTVNASVAASVAIAEGTNPVCSGTSVTFTATPTNGGTTPSYQWMVNGVNAGTNSATYSYIPVNNDIVTCVMTSNAACVTGSPATSNAVTMTVNSSLPASVAIAAGANPVCSGTSVTFTAIPTNGGTTPSYQWMVNGVNAGTNSVTFAYIPVNNDIVTCVMTSNATCVTGSPATSNAMTMTVNPTVAASVTVAAGTNPSCTGTSVTFTATPANGGTTPSFQWNVNGVNAGTNSVTFAYIPFNNDIVTCVMTSNATCVTGSPATSNAVTMTVNSSLPASVAIAAGANPVCSGTSVTCTATPTNGGTTPSYQWKVNGVNQGTNSVTFAYIPVNNDIVTCVMTSNATCVTGSPATSNAVTMTVSSSLPAAVTIAAGANPVCSGTSVTCTATPTNGGTTPSYQWKVNGVNAGTNSVTFAYIPVNNDIVTCVMTSNATCVTGSPATSNAMTMTVNPTVAASVTVAAGTNPSCTGTSVTFTATPTNGGTTPSYQWIVNGVNAGTNSVTFAYIPVNNDIVTCVMTSNATCVTGSPATSNAVTMTVNSSLPASVAIAAGANPVCSGTSVTCTATPTNGGTTPSYQWKVNGVNAGTNSVTFAYIPVNNDIVTCVMTSNATCVTGSPATSNAVTMTVNASVAASVAIAAGTNPVCSGTSVTFTATPTNGGTTPSYQWKVNGVNAGTNSVTFAYIPVNNDIVTCVMTSNATCVTGSPATSNAVTMTVSSSLPAAVTIAAGTNPVCSGTSVTFTATPTNGGTTPSYQWKVNGVNQGTNSVTFAYIPVNNDIVTCVMTSNATCVTGSPATSNAVTMTVNQIPAAAGTVNGPTRVNPGQSGVVYSVPVITNATGYAWTLPTGVTITAGANTASITVTFAVNAVGGCISVHGTNSCGNGTESACLNVSIDTGVTLSGMFSYNNPANTPLDSVWVFLKLNGIKVDSTRTSLLGNYLFTGKQNGIYTVSASTRKPFLGVNGTDAVKVLRDVVGFEPLPTPVRYTAADVNNSLFLNATDANKMMRRFVGLDLTFSRADWSFEKVNGTTIIYPAGVDRDTIIVNGADVVTNFYGLCTGDVDGSAIPGIGAKSGTGFSMITDGVLKVKPYEEFEIPFYAGDDLTVSAISLVLDHSSSSLQVRDVMMNKGTILHNETPGEVRMAWSDINPVNYQKGELIFTLKAMITNEFATTGTIRFEPGPESEFAGAKAEVITEVTLLTPKIELKDPTGIQETGEPIFNVSVFPNPATDHFSLNYETKGRSSVHVSVITLIGQEIMSIEFLHETPGKFNEKINTSGLPHGVYILRITEGGKDSGFFRNVRLIVQ